jgi:hypothetical protein
MHPIPPPDTTPSTMNIRLPEGTQVPSGRGAPSQGFRLRSSVHGNDATTDTTPRTHPKKEPAQKDPAEHQGSHGLQEHRRRRQSRGQAQTQEGTTEHQSQNGDELGPGGYRWPSAGLSNRTRSTVRISDREGVRRHRYHGVLAPNARLRARVVAPRTRL